MKKFFYFILIFLVFFSCKKEQPIISTKNNLEINTVYNVTTHEVPQINLLDKNNLFNIYTIGHYNVDNTPSDITEMVVEDKTTNILYIYKYVSSTKMYFYSLTLAGIINNALEINKIDNNSFYIKHYSIENKIYAILQKTIRIENNAGVFSYSITNKILKNTKNNTKTQLSNSSFDALIKTNITENNIFAAISWIINDDLQTTIFNNSDIEDLLFNMHKAKELLKTEINTSSLDNAIAGNLQTVGDLQTKLSAAKIEYPISSLFFKFKVTCDNYDYTVFSINDKLWFTENLKTTVDALNQQIMSYSYDGVLENSNTYGKLYKYKEAIKACPSGWHLPSRQEWKELVDFYGGSENAYTSLVVGGNSNLNLLFGGYLNTSNEYCRLGSMGEFWTSTKTQDDRAISYAISTNTNSVVETDNNVNYAFSVRCIK